MGRVAGRTRAGGISTALCGLLVDARPYVRANALAGLAISGARCAAAGQPGVTSDGTSERTLLAEDPSEDVRAAAASALGLAPTAEDARALERCARSDPSGAVASRCRTRQPRPTRAHAALIYVIAEGAMAPRPGSAYAMLLADGTIRAGTTDRRGAVFDPVAPEGPVALRPASALAR